ncbi:Beta-lactamase [Streptococcus sp. DD11]|nr:Beta-lactamase [Streptococcus sp. DD11]
MKKRLLLACFLLLGFASPGLALAESQKLPEGTSYDQIGQKIQDFYQKNEKTSAAMETAIFDTEGTIYRGNFGYSDKENQVKADDDTVFEWGSITKLTVWISVMQLWEEGKINLEEDIKTYLPDDFLKNLHFDKPITMLDLMNHQAGFDEQNTYLKGDLSIEELLRTRQPNQVFEPGTVSAYSNYGTGLASYIVEILSGQSFADYVHEHIFQPLKMDKTALLPDLSDNQYVQEKRQEINSYDANGNKKNADFELSLYPVGRATGTLDDLQKFAQGLLKKEALFKRPETWTRLYTATSTYPDTDIPLNAHGFWYQEYGVRLLGHGGNSAGFSSMLLLDLESGLGQVIMTNQYQERIYNYQMPELVFGPKKQRISNPMKHSVPATTAAPGPSTAAPSPF